ncbi:MAG: cohesin domain-containing protein [Fidelibacterota bacterium]
MGKYSIPRFGATAVIIVLLAGACSLTEEEPAFENPFDPTDDNPAFIPVETVITSGPATGDVVDDHTVTFTWTGNEGVVEYSYRLNESAWSDWSPDSAVTYTYLDEDSYIFEVKGRYNEAAEDETPDSRLFEIDDVQGPAFMFFPRKVDVVKESIFAVDIVAEEVTNLAGVNIVVTFDPSLLQLESIDVYDGDTSFFRTNGGTVVSFHDYDNTAGSLTISSGVATGDPAGVDGTGAVAGLNFRAIGSGTTEVVFDTGSKMRNPDNQGITLSDLVKGIVEIE